MASDFMERLRKREAELYAGGGKPSVMQRIQMRAAELAGGNDATAQRDGMRARVEAAKAGRLEMSSEREAQQREIDQNMMDKITLNNAGLATGIVTKVNQGLPFVGEWLDEGIDRINPGQGEYIRTVQGAMDRQYPKTALASEIAGGVVGSAPLAVGAVGTAGKAATRAGRAIRGAVIAGSGAAVEGAVAGAGRNNEDRLGGAVSGGLVGGGLGAVLGAAAPLLGEGVSALAKRIKGLDVNTIADTLGISKPAARVVKTGLLSDDMTKAQAVLARGGDEAMLADAGQATRKLLDASAQSGGEALSVSRARVGDRAARQGGAFKESLDNILGEAGGIKAAARGIAKRTASVRQAAYDRAYSLPIDYASDVGRNIENVLARVPRGTMEAAVKEANEAMQEAGTRNLQIMVSIGEDGSLTITHPMNVQQLDYLKRALGDVAQANKDQFGRLTAAGQRASRLAGDLRDAVGDAVPSYKRAVKLGGDKIAEDNALDVGRNLLSARSTVEDVRNAVKGMSKEAKLALRRGLRENIDTIMDRARTTISDIEAGTFDFETGMDEAKQAFDALRAMTTAGSMKKLRLSLGGDANALIKQMQKTSDALSLRASIAANSATALRKAIQGQIADEVAPGIIRKTAGNMGNPLEAARSITQELVGVDARSLSREQRAMFAEIAKTLTGIRGQEAQRALAAVQASLAGQPMKDADAELIGRLFAGAAAGSGYQAASQSLQMP